MAALSTQEITPAGTAPTFDPASAGGDDAETGNRVTLVVKNSDGAATHDVTLATPGNLETGEAYPDRTYTVPISGEVWVPLLNVYRDDDGRAQITYSDETNLTVAVVKR